jgi:hypothetical protein
VDTESRLRSISDPAIRQFNLMKAGCNKIPLSMVEIDEHTPFYENTALPSHARKAKKWPLC